MSDISALPSTPAMPGARQHGAHGLPQPSAILELLKPVTWFAPMWAFMCGVVSAGAPFADTWHLAFAGAVLAGPLVCATSQAVNDWFDREVDAINEPGRPIPSGRIPGDWGLRIAIAWTALSLLAGALLGPWVLAATVVGLALSWAYSAPPLRLKRSGWLGPATTGFAYEGLAWFTGAAVVLQALPDPRILVLAALFSLGAHGIMTLNDFKAVEGDRRSGIRTLPVQYGVRPAVLIACLVMVVPQLVVVALLFGWNLPIHAAIVASLLAVQVTCMFRLADDPEHYAPWFNATGVLLYVLGMLAAAIGVGSLAGVSA